jgi:hypothetical protein
MPYRLRREDQVDAGWHRKRDDALRNGEPRGWTIQGPPGCYTLADGVELEEQPSLTGFGSYLDPGRLPPL